MTTAWWGTDSPLGHRQPCSYSCGQGCGCELDRRAGNARLDALRELQRNEFERTEPVVATTPERKIHLSLRALDEARLVLKWARIQLVISLVVLAALTGLWVYHLSNEYNGAGYIWSIVGLVVLTGGAGGWVAGAGTYTSDRAKARRKARYDHEDELVGFSESKSVGVA